MTIRHPRERRLSAWALAPGLLLAGVACDSETALQVVVGSAPPMTGAGPLRSAMAWDRTTLLAAAPLDTDGSFILAIPPAEAVQITLVTAAGRSIPVGDSPIRICAATAAVDLGRLVEAPADVPCLPSAACSMVDAFLDECIMATQERCAGLGADVQVCHDMRDLNCAPMRDALDQCLLGGPPCEFEQMMLDDCERGVCEDVEMGFFEQCLGVCEEERTLRDEVCLLDEEERCRAPEPSGVGRLMTTDPYPTIIGCPQGSLP